MSDKDGDTQEAEEVVEVIVHKFTPVLNEWSVYQVTRAEGSYEQRRSMSLLFVIIGISNI
jgi:hypothetical protein